MKNHQLFKVNLLAAVMALASGCASSVISDKSLMQKTAFSLGLNESDITLLSRENDGFMTRYVVQAKSGKKFNCEVGGTIGVVGEPGCLEVNSSSNGCNALQKAAHKCK